MIGSRPTNGSQQTDLGCKVALDLKPFYVAAFEVSEELLRTIATDKTLKHGTPSPLSQGPASRTMGLWCWGGKFIGAEVFFATG